MLSEKTRKNYEECILPFWKNLMDEKNGGFYGYVDFDLHTDREAPKGVILNSRILWFFSNAYLTYGDEEALFYARHAYDFLRKHCLDRENGGIYWLLEADGPPFLILSTPTTTPSPFTRSPLITTQRAITRPWRRPLSFFSWWRTFVPTKSDI